MSARVGDVLNAVSAAFPPEWAEGWDRVGLLAGDPNAQVTGVSLALDPTRAAIAAAAGAGANLLVTHHPAYLEPPAPIAPGPGAGGVVFAALDAGVALVNAHTNLDRAPGAGRLLPARLGVVPRRPIERTPMPMAVVTVYVPPASLDAVADAMAAAGAGRLGDYERCLYTVQGFGQFDASLDANPAVGVAGERTLADESRLEMVCSRGAARGVIAAARDAHPYEEPLITSTDVVIARSSARMGMLCDVVQESELTLGDLAERAAIAFGITPRVWGDPSSVLTLVATATGSAGSLVGDVRSAGAQALVAGEVRYHDALEAVENGLAVIELGHDVSEWPLVELLRDAVLATPDLDPTLVTVQPATPGWWTPGKDR